MNLYFECTMGAAGDMIAAALVDLFEDKEAIVRELNSLSLPRTTIAYAEADRSGIKGAHLNVVINGETETPNTHDHSRCHRNLAEIAAVIDALSAEETVKSDAKKIYSLIAEAEAKVHHVPAGEVHFHELGTLDAVADVTLCAYLIRKLKPEKITASPINVGSGTVNCAHGILPVPAPATAEILKGVPYYKSAVPTELCTPTGAAILKYYVSEFTAEPLFQHVVNIGIGTGTKELEQANILRAFVFEDDSVTELSCNIDDMTGEETAFAAEVMMNKGALDCFISPVFMKKGRPAYLFTVICKTAQSETFAKLIFQHTTTLGIRKYTPSRYTLERTVTQESGVHIKRSEGYGAIKEKPEFEDIKQLALENDISLFEARKIIRKP